jgi:RNA polymerase sigma-70 factor (ECF subfamily)
MFRRQTYKNITDNELAAAYRQSADQAIIGEIYLRFGHLMFGTCLNYLKDKEAAEDCVMELFEQLPAKLKKHEVEYFKSWLFMFTKNACLMLLRKKKLLTSELEESLTAAAPQDQHNKLELEQQLVSLESAIEELNDEQKTAIQLFYIDRKSYTEVSEIMAIPLKKVKSAIQNGKRNLKMKLEKNGSAQSA